jgi:hypothetical protein
MLKWAADVEVITDKEAWKNYQRLLIKKANANLTLWMTAALIWGMICFVMVFLVNRWEEGQGLEHEPVPPRHMP